MEGYSPLAWMICPASIFGWRPPNFWRMAWEWVRAIGGGVEAHLLGLRHIHVAHDVEDDVVGAVVHGVVELYVLLAPAPDEVLLSDGEPLRDAVLAVQR